MSSKSISLTNRLNTSSDFEVKNLLVATMWTLFALLSLIFGIVYSEGDVVELNESNFEHLTQLNSGATTGDWFVEFFAPWCGHCKRLAPTWEEVATELKGQTNVAKVDVTQNRAIGKQFGVKGFPTLLLFRKVCCLCACIASLRTLTNDRML